jgi:uncharacterized protein (DUF58 family)
MKKTRPFTLNTLKKFFKKHRDAWLTKRIPTADFHQLTSRNIFIFPTAFGFVYLGFVVLLFLLATNYQNNLIMLLSYLLASFFITVMMHSFYNFTQLSFSARQQQTGFAQQGIIFPLIIHSKKKHYDLNFILENKNLSSISESHFSAKVSQCTSGNTRVNLSFNSAKRGEFSLGRVTIFSEYSFGLFKSWTHLDFGLSALVYPKPLPLILDQQQLSGQKDDTSIRSYQASNMAGIDDFSELKRFTLGESRARTAWKQLARGQGHFSKHYQENQSALLCLKLADMPVASLETQLSYLSFLVNELTQDQQTFSLQLELDKDVVTSNSGMAHQQACLTALALHHV